MSVAARIFSVLRLQPRSRWLFVVLVPWVVPVLGHLLVGKAYWSRPSSFVGATLVLGLSLWLWVVALDRATTAIVRRFPGLHQTSRRVLLTTVACFVLAAVFIAAVNLGFAYFQPFGSTLTMEELRAHAGITSRAQAWFSDLLGVPVSRGATFALIYGVDLLGLLLMVVLYESFYLLAKWQESKVNYEHLKKAGLESQLQSLKTQINPHFLFNTLNTLSSLIAEEPRRAERFVDEIAKVYRYLLQTNEDELTPLANELAFIESYYHLLKTRHGKGLQLRVHVDEALLQHRLPSLSLQMLLENAVKHNVIQGSRPLRVDIATTPAGELSVGNNMQRRTTLVESAHVGLANIAARYRLLNRSGPLVESDADRFVVTLPLLPPA